MTHDRQHSGNADGKHGFAPRLADAGAVETETGPGSHQDGEQSKGRHADDSSRVADDALMRCYNG